ncbi:hypothetical protein [Amycolatopsis sp. NBC_00438]|uniref:hypothetical protein n=1 Tax=Amycolatopsis sp. NBC_00438 TaxID=2903558 RepID=UPI002E1F05E5
MPVDEGVAVLVDDGRVVVQGGGELVQRVLVAASREVDVSAVGVNQREDGRLAAVLGEGGGVEGVPEAAEVGRGGGFAGSDIGAPGPRVSRVRVWPVCRAWARSSWWQVGRAKSDSSSPGACPATSTNDSTRLPVVIVTLPDERARPSRFTPRACLDGRRRSSGAGDFAGDAFQ